MGQAGVGVISPRTQREAGPIGCVRGSNVKRGIQRAFAHRARSSSYGFFVLSSINISLDNTPDPCYHVRSRFNDLFMLTFNHDVLLGFAGF